MTGTAKKTRLQSPTDWQDVPSDRDTIPVDVVMILELSIDGEYTDYTMGFFSGRTKSFLEIPNRVSLEEAVTVTGYHVLYDRNSALLTAYSSD